MCLLNDGVVKQQKSTQSHSYPLKTISTLLTLIPGWHNLAQLGCKLAKLAVSWKLPDLKKDKEN